MDGINYNSPTIQNMMMGGEVYNTSPPTFNSGVGYQTNNYFNNPAYGYGQNMNMRGVMNQGYNNGYYQYQNYYNPMAVSQYYQEMQRQQQAAVQNEIEIQKMMMRIVCANYHISYDEDYYESLINPYDEINLERQKFESDYDQMCQIAIEAEQQKDSYINPSILEARRLMCNIHEQNMRKHPADQSFKDYMDTAYDLQIEALEKESLRNQRKETSRLYDSNSYNQLLASHQGMYNSLRGGNIDDISISLPPSLRNTELAEKKRKFMNALLGGLRV